MKRVVFVVIVAGVFAGMLTGCQALLDLLMQPTVPATPIERVQGFLAAASADPQEPAAMKAFFDPDAGQYVNMNLDSYWELTFFATGQRPFSIVNPIEGAAGEGFPESTTVTGSVTDSGTTTGYAAVFVLTTDPDDPTADPLIRKITIDSGDIPIEKVSP